MAEPTPRPGSPPGVSPALAAYLAGDPDGRERLVRAFRGVVRDAVVRFLTLRVRSRLDLADDLTHEVFVALFADEGRKLRTFTGRHGASFAGWLKVVAVRLTIDRLRHDRRMALLDDETPAMEAVRRSLRSEAPTPEEAMQGAETAARLARVLATLGPKDKLLAELHLVRGRSLEEVARVLGVSKNAAYVRKSRLLERLRRVIGGGR